MKTIAILLGLLLAGFSGYSQQVELRYKDKPLNEVLLDLRDRYEFQFSFDNELLSAYPVSAERSCNSLGEALGILLDGLPLSWEQSENVFVIFPKLVAEPSRSFLISGVVRDAASGETLPYAHLQFNGKGLITDQNGAFAYRLPNDDSFQLRISYLGYYLADTLVRAGTNQQFFLKPSVVRLQEIRIEGLPVVRTEQVGQKAGEIRLNHQIAGSLPGYGDNSVFNLLRLQPGILAAGEQSNDLMIRGSYEGQSLVLFDGFTLFGMKNFNDNISAVNPFMAKDIRVMKGVYAAEYGDRVGGIVEITGVDGNPEKWQAQASVNNMTMNAMLNVPLSKKLSLLVAARQTYYELYDKNQLTLGTSGRSGRGNLVDRYVFPDYNFGDYNLKLAGNTDANDFYRLSLFRGQDRYRLGLNYESSGQNNQLAYEDKESNLQYGASAAYSKFWKGGLRSELLLAWSSLETDLHNLRQSAGQNGGSGGSGNTGGNGNGQGGNPDTGSTDAIWNTDSDDLKNNRVSEFKVQLQNHLPLNGAQKLGFGLGFIENEVRFRQDSFRVMQIDEQNGLSRVHAYVEDHWSATDKLQLTAGIRLDWATEIQRLDWQPRLSLGYQLSKAIRLTVAAGTYRQYLSRTSTIDALGNYHYLWAVCNDADIPVLESQQAVGGFSWQKNDFSLSLEAYQKHTKGLSRYVETVAGTGLYQGDAKTSGLDVLLKKDWKGHAVWLAYTLSKTREHFSYFEPGEYLRALHDQRHELKAAALVNLKPVYLSANYVFGSGFPALADNPETENYPYHRVDVAASYRLIRKSFSLETGVSVLNLFNYENIKYANFVRIPDEQDVTLDISAEAVPFTPTVFLKVAF